MGEIPLYIGQGFQTTINQMGISSIYIPSTGYGKCTCYLYFGKLSEWKESSLLIITRGEKDNIKCISSIYVPETEKAWCTQTALRKWINLMLPLVLRGNQRVLLIFDSRSAHRAKDMKNLLVYRIIDQIRTPD